ncbi:hypothetical protein J2743_001302 [Methanobacterium petrolearium]|nr:hypothetical protein [Methanobacterium petrolearium]BDZ72225.1 hypothetical protein GCM10025861_27420 [Methanobacterium petrolearium]
MTRQTPYMLFVFFYTLEVYVLFNVTHLKRSKKVFFIMTFFIIKRLYDINSS